MEAIILALIGIPLLVTLIVGLSTGFEPTENPKVEAYVFGLWIVCLVALAIIYATQ